jgi:heme A synthase
MIEFTHRASSGIAFLFVLGMLIWAWRNFPRGNQVRYGALLSMVFMITEALLGAGLVLFELVAEDTSTARAISISIHLANTFLLLACLSLTAWWASGGKPANFHVRDTKFWFLMIGFLGILVLGMSGALTALGDTLFPVASLQEGIRQDFSSTAHFLVRLRILHPTIAVMVGIYLIILIGWISSQIRNFDYKVLGRITVSLIVLQLLAGLVNVILRVPIWMQLVHLFLADLIWICFVIFASTVLSIDGDNPVLENKQMS